MRRHRVIMVLAGAAAIWCAGPLAVLAAAAGGAVAQTGTWRTAIEVPGLGSLNGGGFAGVDSVSCGSAGNCGAGGFYTDRSAHLQAFVVNQKRGSWRRAIEVPGLGILNAGGSASVASVSCASAGKCAAGGSYRDGSGHQQAFVASEKHGTWGTAIEVPRSAALNTGGIAGVTSVSCASAGNCAAGGSYTGSFIHVQAFVDSQMNGTWGAAIEVPGSASLNIGGMAQVNSVSCASAGNCAAAGSYVDGLNHGQALVASETNGTWGTAIEVPGSGALNAGGAAAARWVSCPSAGNCAVGGSYRDGSGHFQAFVDSQA